MSEEVQSVTTLRITLNDLRWFVFAVRNVQTRSAGETATRMALISRFDEMIDSTIAPNMREPLDIPFSQDQLRICVWAANEGRCRDGDEMLIKGRLRQMFNEACGIQGVNGLV
jgi:hypothetical protein